ncbi:MAG: tRNA uridine-5-carboxymethylaminomethyl(34) synthesis enzyme MnmG [Ruminococcus sp.]|jgi:tRNA uridine 5-carboxymethylaminomethyl modification enzyme|nr:tRNA uridine-5-carboxymethylaminomethyl(34) synthesis enzyme MnmG [Ruminococcus sp.]
MNESKNTVCVIGAGHAGVEAALASARLGVTTLLFTLTLDNIANMPCNPSIGGTAKGHLVREIDALGGEMGKAADATFLQSRLLNSSKGPAVRSLRVQSDRSAYHTYMKSVCEKQENLFIIQAEVTEIIIENNCVKGVKTRVGMIYEAACVIISTGTYLKGEIHVGENHYSSGPDSTLPANLLSESLKKAGITLRRFKTGTPCRVHRRSVDFNKLEKQDGDIDSEIQPFSFSTPRENLRNQISCYIAYTNDKTHEIIRRNIKRSAMYSGNIEGVGPRYCPSIEDKIMRFSDKPRHQLFIEPMGLSTDEIYLQGMSSSLPLDVQQDFVNSIKGLEKAEIMRNAYAIEYDCCDPTEMLHTMRFKSTVGLYGAGQFCGTSGYEEAAAQGLIAGINAALFIKGEPEITLTRNSSYIGTLIDDLVIKGCQDPYRMMTSRSEYRLLLRQDNADLRLTPLGNKIGLISPESFEHFREKQWKIDREILRMKNTTIAPSVKLNEKLAELGTVEISTGVKLSDLIKRPQIKYSDLKEFDEAHEDLPRDVIEEAEIIIEYEGYIKIQQQQADKMLKLEAKLLPEDLDYNKINGLSLEAREKLSKIRPRTFGEASRISGVSPADIQILMITQRTEARGQRTDL